MKTLSQIVADTLKANRNAKLKEIQRLAIEASGFNVSLSLVSTVKRQIGFTNCNGPGRPRKTAVAIPKVDREKLIGHCYRLLSIATHGQVGLGNNRELAIRAIADLRKALDHHELQ